MKTYTINFTNGRKIRITGEPADIESLDQSGVVVLRNGVDTYNFFREAVLYWTVCDGEPATTPREDAMRELTERQIQILKLMALEKTNASIAREIGYSESTVRQETMAIYKILGVSCRKEAVQAAKLDNLIEV